MIVLKTQHFYISLTIVKILVLMRWERDHVSELKLQARNKKIYLIRTNMTRKSDMG